MSNKQNKQYTKPQLSVITVAFDKNFLGDVLSKDSNKDVTGEGGVYAPTHDTGSEIWSSETTDE
jgi:hypothetical protein